MAAYGCLGMLIHGGTMAQVEMKLRKEYGSKK